MFKRAAIFIGTLPALLLTGSVLLSQKHVQESHRSRFFPPHLRHLEPEQSFPDERLREKALDMQNNWEQEELLVGLPQRELSQDAVPTVSPPNPSVSEHFPRPMGSSTDSVQVAWVSHYASGLITGENRALATTIDDSGNVYVTGRSYGSGTDEDYCTIKYNTSGEEQWVARYNGPNNLPDYATAIAIDESDNVYVTGSSQRTPLSWDYVTIKYNSSGVEQWVARYEGPEGISQATALAVDTWGNVYVTGWSYGSGTSLDYATIKYNSSGVEQWVSRYDGPSNWYDSPTALSVDDSGNVYVTGSSRDSTADYDYATIKYSSSGVEQWVACYNGPANSEDHATALTVDNAGNVYVTGFSRGSGTFFDYATIKYNNLGEEQWVARYDGPDNWEERASALSVDDSGNVYVTGYSEGSGTFYDYATIKYNSSGIEQWVARYDGPDNWEDRASALSVDDSGNVYVTGYSTGLGTSWDYATVKYDSSGVQLWVVRYNGQANAVDAATALAIDASGNVHVTGFSRNEGGTSDYATVRYNNSGEEQWVARYRGPGDSDDRAVDLAIDSFGNVYVTGSSMDSTAHYDYATIKYSSSGVEQWVARYNGPANSVDHPTALTVDNSGNVYVTGYSRGSGTFFDYATIKYNNLGEEQWVARYDGPANSDDRAAAIAVDASGNIYVTGKSYSSTNNYDYATIKYNSSGIEQWVTRYNGPSSSSDSASAVAVDNSGNVYVTGSSIGPGTYLDYTTIKYNSSGEEQWVGRYDGQASSWDVATALAVDEAGNVYVTGYSSVSGTMYYDDYATVKYSNSGEEQWVAGYNGPGDDWDVATAIAIDTAGNIYVTGWSYGSGTSLDYATIKYNSSGVEQWVSRYDSPQNYADWATSLAIDQSGNVYVTGYSANSNTPPYNYDYATVKYNSSGDQQWVSRYNGPLNSEDYSVAVGVDASSDVHVTGYSSDGEWRNYTTIKYIQTPTSIGEQTTDVPQKYSLSQNYPNPFNAFTSIGFSLLAPESVTLKVYNLLGQEVATLISERLQPGNHEIRWDAAEFSSGVYYYRLKAGRFSATKKLLLLK